MKAHSLKCNKWLIAALAVAGAAVLTANLAADESYDELQSRLDAAEAKIASMLAPSHVDIQRAEATKAIIADVLADADYRTMMQGQAKKNPVTVNVHGFAQFRWSYNDTKMTGVDETHGFSVPRVRLILEGDIYDWSYRVSGQWNDGGAFDLKDAYADWNGFRFGQFKSPFMREVLTAQVDTLAAERSIVAHEFGQGRSQGIQYGHDFGSGFKVTGAYTDGFNSANGAGVQNGYALTGRVDWDAANWLDVGFAGSHNNLNTTSYNTWTADAAINWKALAFTASYTATSGDIGDSWGAVLNAAYTMDKWEPFVQYERGSLDGSTEDLSVATFGVNYYFNKNVKWTTDLGYALNSIDAGWRLGDTGWNTTTEDGEYLLRTQLQVQF